MTDTTPAPELMPCPFCTEGKSVSTYFDHEQGDKWGYASCDACGARGPEVRTNYDRDDNAPWRAEAIAAWNTRADLIPAALAVPEVRALVPDAMREMIVQAVRFANLAAGEGITIDGLLPEIFLLDYSEATDEEDWHTLAERVDAALREGDDPHEQR